MCCYICVRPQALLNAHYNYGQGRLACRLRAALTTAVFDKARPSTDAAWRLLCARRLCWAWPRT